MVFWKQRPAGDEKHFTPKPLSPLGWRAGEPILGHDIDDVIIPNANPVCLILFSAGVLPKTKAILLVFLGNSSSRLLIGQDPIM